jgi:hypothetical protein
MSAKKKAAAKPSPEKLHEQAMMLSAKKRDELAGMILSSRTREELAGRRWPKETREKFKLSLTPTVYIQDPWMAKRNPRFDKSEVEVPWERGLADGPTSARIAVVDYDGDTDRLNPPARWNRETWSFTGEDGKSLPQKPKESLQFHQVNVWAVIMKVIELFEEPSALGRPVPWAFPGNRLIVVPHAGYGENAFYDRRSKSLQFYYFGTKKQTVFTCLSHDIIAHETGHAILDGVRPLYNEISSFQTSAFHEFTADLTTIVSALRNNDLRAVLKAATAGDLSRKNFIANVAEGFGTHVVNRPYLRTAHNDHSMRFLNMAKSPHANSQVLTGAMFDIMAGMAANYMEQREKTPGEALWHTVDRFRRVALQALDYCPPADIQFGDYADAVLRRDQIGNPMDPHGYRAIMRQVFDKRGINHSVPEKEPNYSNLHFSHVASASTDLNHVYSFLHERRRKLLIPENQDIEVLLPYRTNKVRRQFERLPREIVIQYLWREGVELKGTQFRALDGATVPLLCGGTLVYDERGNLLHWSRKPGTRPLTSISGRKPSKKENIDRDNGKKRREQLLDYIAVCIRKRYLGMQGAEAGTIDTWSPMEAFMTDEGIRIDTTPRLHAGGDEE